VDADRFDDVTRLFRRLATRGSRREALGILLGGGLIGLLGSAEAGGKKRAKDRAKSKGKGRNPKKRKDRKQHDAQAQGGEEARLSAEAVQCEPPRHSARLTNCQYPNRDLAGVDMHASTLTGANFSGAKLCGAKLYSAQLKNADFRGADLTKADLHSSGCAGTKFNVATTFCATIDCNGNLRNDDCPGADPELVCCTVADCRPGAACTGGRCIGGCDVCPTGCRFTSLEAAVNDPGTQDGATIRICPGIYPTFHEPVGVRVNKNLTIIGAGSGDGGTVLDGQNESRVLLIDTGKTVTIQDLTITRGTMEGEGFLDGGAIFNVGSLTLERVVVTGNTAGGDGGGIYSPSGSTLVVKQSQITRNTGLNGGGIQTNGKVSLDGTRVELNTATFAGGVYINILGEVTLSNGSIVTRNTATSTASDAGGGIRNGNKVFGATTSNVIANTPSDCINVFGGTGCPA
jgi:predicted outer membrane repeat protein